MIGGGHPAVVAGTGLAVLLVVWTALWWVSLLRRDASIADPAWAPGFFLAALAYVFAAGDVTFRSVLVTSLVGLWALRLGTHLLARNRAHGEDPRYQAMRARHGAAFGRVSLVTVFWLQALLIWVVSAPLLGVAASAGADGPGAWDALGLALSVAGIGCEAIADRQLARFKADPANRGRVLRTGLWRYSRHPNYFGNALLWWGLYLFALAAGAWWTVVGPIVMTVLLLRVSGVTLLEEGLRKSRPGYDDYVRTTSAFVPWPPKRP